MCGITGFLNLDGKKADPALLPAMVSALAHRGPDGEGAWTGGNAALGHRRLAVLDLTPAGAQPVRSADGRFVASYNGETYNFRELRAELEKTGCSFRSSNDAEVVVNAWARWGPGCLEKFNGMFALAVHDTRTGTLHLARDRYGIKPLYFALFDGVFLFGSEQKALLAHPAARREIDLEALAEYFTFQNIFTDRTLLRGIRLLPAGCRATLEPGSRRLEFKRYWDYAFEEPERPAAGAEYVEELDRLMGRAVRRQLVSDVEVGAYLSGGIDSAAVTALAAADLPNIKSFTCGFDLHSASGLEMAFDEREKAEHLSYLFRTEHYEMVLKAGDMERAMPELSRHLEEPRVGQSYPNYYITRLASRFVKVVLSGASGDELFGGYPWRYYRALGEGSFADYIDRYYACWQRLLDEREMGQVMAPVREAVSRVAPREIFESVFQHHFRQLRRPEDFVNHSLYFEAKTFLHGLLVVEDKLSMAHGLETRLPFLDNDLVDFAMRVPVALKLDLSARATPMNENEPGAKTEKYYRRTRNGKLILRKFMEKHLPAVITEAEKQGFSAPDASWFKGESIDFVRRTVYDPGALIYRYLDRRAVCRLVDEHLEGRRNRRLFIWSLINFEWWLRNYLP